MDNVKCNVQQCKEQQSVTIRVECETGPEFFAVCWDHIETGILVLKGIQESLKESEKQ